MSSGFPKSGTSKPGPGAGQFPVANNQTLLLEKVNARTSTPDSEALASSDDEGDNRQEPGFSNVPHPKPVRRSSWLNDTSQPFSRPRKGSFASSSMSPTASHPSTPSAETVAGPWGSHSTSSVMGRGSGNFPWGTGIWNSERKEAPTRFSEVLPSPTSTNPPGGGGNSFFGPADGLMQTSPARDPMPNQQIPFAIPLHPTPKTYRSQSYSVGQVDPDTNIPASVCASTGLGRARHPALQHRPSRPSMLSEMSNDASMLGKVKEVDDDDDESATDSMQNSFHQSSESRTIEMLTRENAMLRQQQQQQQQYTARMRPRASTGGGFLGNGYPLQEAVPEESDFAVDELEGEQDSGESFAKRASARRMSEYASGTAPLRSPFGGEGRKADKSNLKRALWSSQLGFTGGDVSQSRRHSFANMPTRQGSISSLAESTSTLDASVPEGQLPPDFGSAFEETLGFAGNAPGYYSSVQGLAGNSLQSLQPGFGTAYPSAYGLQHPFAQRAPSPHRNLYGNMAQPRQNQLLHIVLFKCARADVFYIQEGTGLTVKPGDLVIVEADRGTDLGTVAKDNVDWQSAKDLKEHYAEEQYKWLMMYSQGAAAAQEGSGAGLLASSGGAQASAIGGMGPATQHHMQEPNSGELRPKLIKRLAQSHEVHALRDKEGQEAKAKRVCMQKVKEHGLNMEILDAEFQMDWKKLTFYYFADAYINFNSLVTDLFKIYKTRIWMSAINPASFASPTLGIQAPSGVGPGAVNASRSSAANERRQPQQPPQQGHDNQAHHAYANAPQGGRGFRQPFNQPFPTESSSSAAHMQGQPNYGFSQPGGFGQGRPNVGYAPSVPPNMEGFGTLGFQQPDFQSMRHRFPTPNSATSPAPHSQGMSPVSSANDWTGGFQGLSLNGH